MAWRCSQDGLGPQTQSVSRMQTTAYFPGRGEAPVPVTWRRLEADPAVSVSNTAGLTPERAPGVWLGHRYSA